MKTLEEDLQDLKEFFTNASQNSSPERGLGDRDVDKACLRGRSEAYAFAAPKIQRLLQWHGIEPGGKPIQSENPSENEQGKK